MSKTNRELFLTLIKASVIITTVFTVIAYITPQVKNAVNNTLQEFEFKKETKTATITPNINQDDIVYLFGSIDDYNTILAIVQLHEKEKRGKPIWLVISSNGGSVIAAARLIAVMNSLKVPIYTVCELACESAAAAILVNGDKVYAREHSRIMFHNFVTQLTGSSSAIQEELEHTNKIFGDLNAPVLRRTSLTKEEFDAKLLKTWYLTSTEALNLRLLDGHVIISTELFKRDSTTSIPNVLEK